MAKNIPYQQKEYNGADWDFLFPKTIADQVGTTEAKQFVSKTEKDSWNAKLDTSVYTAADILSKLKTVDGTGSGLDADLLDGKEATAFALLADIANFLSKSGGTMTGDIVLKGEPTAALHPATKQYVDGLLQGLTIKPSCKVATTANITLSGTQTIDGVAVVAGDRVLVKNQTTGSANGIYVVASGAWTRATDADTAAELKSMFTFIEQGTVNSDTGWVMITDNITLNTTALVYTQFSGAGSITDATSSVSGTIKLGSDTVQTVAPTTPTATASRTYPIQKNANGQAVVNVPWTDTNTTYTAMTQTEADTGTGTTARTITPKVLSDTIGAKIHTGATTPTNAKTGDLFFDYNN